MSPLSFTELREGNRSADITIGGWSFSLTSTTCIQADRCVSLPVSVSSRLLHFQPHRLLVVSTAPLLRRAQRGAGPCLPAAAGRDPPGQPRVLDPRTLPLQLEARWRNCHQRGAVVTAAVVGARVVTGAVNSRSNSNSSNNGISSNTYSTSNCSSINISSANSNSNNSSNSNSTKSNSSSNSSSAYSSNSSNY